MTETGWLIEKKNREYITVLNEWGYEWTMDVSLAIRFARRKDAERIALLIKDYDRIREHKWESKR